MSYINISEDLFLEKQEYQRFQKFLMDEGYKRHLLDNTEKFGFIKNEKLDPNFTSGLVSEGGTLGNININSITFLDSNGNYGVLPSYTEYTTGILDGETYWINTSHKFSTEEVGTVSIDANGNLTGIGTKFTEVLRGASNFQSAITFSNSTNTATYYVQEVIDDENAILSGTFSVESGLKYSVLGTFTPSAVPLDGDKYPFQYDSANLFLNKETTSQVNPVAETDTSFAIARITRSGGSLIIEDKRTKLWKTKAENQVEKLPLDSPCIGVEAVKYKHPTDTRVKNLVEVAWGFRTDDWTMNPSLNQITINAGKGGLFKTTGDFTTGDFNGMRLYSENGKYSLIKSSVKQGSQITIKLEQLNPSDFTNDDYELFITPDCESIEIISYADSVSNLANDVYGFPINTKIGRIDLTAYQDAATYDLKYRFINNHSYSEEKTFESDTENGYYIESSFDENGVLNTNPDNVSRKTYDTSTSNWLVINRSATSYSNFVERIDLNDNYGFEVIEDLWNSVSDVAGNALPIKVGVNKQNIRIAGSSPLAGNVKIELYDTDAKDGSEFYIFIDTPLVNDVSNNKYTVKVTENILGVSNGIYQLTQKEINSGQIHVKAVFQDGSWEIEKSNESYDGTSVFQNGFELIDINNTIPETVNGVQREVIVISGTKEVILLTDSNSSGKVPSSIKILNGKHINNFKILISENSPTSISVAPRDFSALGSFNGYLYYGFRSSYTFEVGQSYTFYSINNGELKLHSSSESIESTAKVEFPIVFKYFRETTGQIGRNEDNAFLSPIIYGPSTSEFNTTYRCNIQGVVSVEYPNGAFANKTYASLIDTDGNTIYTDSVGVAWTDVGGVNENDTYAKICIPITYNIYSYKRSSGGDIANKWNGVRLKIWYESGGTDTLCLLKKAELNATFYPENFTNITSGN